MINLIKDTILYVLNTLLNDAVPLALGIAVASIVNVYVDPDKFKKLLMKRKKVSIFGSVAFGTFTPLCSCGTMAIIISMLTTVLPWGPIMAFITSSPLMSPDLFVMLSGIISVKFASALTVSSLFIGISAGYISYYLEKHTNFFDNQIRFNNKQKTGESLISLSCCAQKPVKLQESCCLASANDDILAGVCCAQGLTNFKASCCTAHVNKEITADNCCSSNFMASQSDEICCSQDDSRDENSFIKKYKLQQLFSVFINIGIKQILLYFSVFAAIGYLINRFIPASIIMSLFGSKNMFSIPLAALIGIPLYVSDAGTIPLIQILMKSGASGGAMLAFMITGPGTSIGAIAGSLTIMKRKAVLFYVGILLISAVLLGYLYNFLLFMGL